MSGILGILLLVALVFIVINVARFGISILISVVFWAIAGWLASRLTGGDGAGILGNILLGVIGGAVGSFILGLLNLNFFGDVWVIGNIIVGVIGAVILIFAARALGLKDFGR